MKLEMYPLMEVPFDSYCMLLDVLRHNLIHFVPTTMEEDLKQGKIHTIVYWYPRLVLKLYDKAYDGENFREYLDLLNPQNSLFFEQIFQDTTKKLDELAEKNIQKNHMDEIIVKNGKIK